MSKSILTEEQDRCYICGGRREAWHHIYEGTGRRNISERHGFKVPLCNKHHNMSDYSVHFDKGLELLLKRECQKAYELQGHSREEFIALIGRNYLD